MIHHAEFLRLEGNFQRDAAPCDVVLFHVFCPRLAGSRRLSGDSFLGSGLPDPIASSDDHLRAWNRYSLAVVFNMIADFRGVAV
jgi:hypothetical protein